MLDHAHSDCPELLKPIATNVNNNPTQRRLDNLISSLTGGKTYIDILESMPNITTDITFETKYLSLSLKRADMAKLSVSDYETVIQTYLKGELPL
jgi:hypothetical protein